LPRVPNLLCQGDLPCCDSSPALSPASGAFLIRQSRAERRQGLPAAPAPRASSLFGGDEALQAPEASAKPREEKRFSRYGKNKEGKIEAEQYFAARRKNFDKLDIDHSGTLNFQEYAGQGDRQGQCRRRPQRLAE
jgi:hypothetical protein